MPLTENHTADLRIIYGLQMDTKHTWTLNGRGGGGVDGADWN